MKTNKIKCTNIETNEILFFDGFTDLRKTITVSRGSYQNGVKTGRKMSIWQVVLGVLIPVLYSLLKVFYAQIFSLASPIVTYLLTGKTEIVVSGMQDIGPSIEIALITDCVVLGLCAIISIIFIIFWR
jgi:hypothetical protein